MNLPRFPIQLKNGSSIFWTRQELKCANYLAQGQSTKEIARILSISPRTVESHLKNIKNKGNIYSNKDIIKLYRANFNSNFINFASTLD
jgi:DNA-binding CsgD family transcriptional regulator